LEKLSFPPHCLNPEVSEDLCVHHLLSPRANVMRWWRLILTVILPMLHSHSIFNKASYICQHMFASVFQSRDDNGNSLSCGEWKISWDSLWPVGTTPEPQIKEYLPLKEVDRQQRDMRFKPNEN
jgi:hypothetical protein